MFHVKAKMTRPLSACAAILTVGLGTLTMVPAANAATLWSTSGHQRAESVLTKSISRDWEGRYTCAQGLTGLDLRIHRHRHSRSLRARFSFYPLRSNPTVPVGIYTMRGRYHSAARIVLRGHRWVLRPSGFSKVGLSGRLSGRRFHGTVHGSGCTTFSLRKPVGHRSRSDVVATWKGSYVGCGQGPTGLRLVIKRKGSAADRLKARFNFFALPGNPTVPSGSYAMTGFYFPGGVALYGTRWIHQPPGFSMVNLVGKPPRSTGKRFRGAVVGCSTFSLKRS